MSVNFIFGPEPEGVPGTVRSTSSIADTGGLVAKGEGTGAPKPRAPLALLNPLKLDIPAELGGGLVTDVGVAGTGAVPLLNSAQRGHLRLVFMWPI